MLVFVWLVATLNLGVGYVLGAGRLPPLTVPALPQLPRGFGKNSEPDPIDDESLTRPVASAEPQSPEEETADQEQKRAKPTHAELVAGLTKFRTKLNNASLELKLSQEDPNRFEECANKLQSANHEYLEHTNEVIESFESAGEAAGGEACDALNKNAQEAEQLSGKIDEILEQDLNEEGRSELIATSEAMRENAATLEKQATVVAAEIEAAQQQSETAEEEPEGAAKDPPAAETGPEPTEEADSRADAPVCAAVDEVLGEQP